MIYASTEKIFLAAITGLAGRNELSAENIVKFATNVASKAQSFTVEKRRCVDCVHFDKGIYDYQTELYKDPDCNLDEYGQVQLEDEVGIAPTCPFYRVLDQSATAVAAANEF